MDQIGKGFERLLELADDLELDNPDAHKMLAQFLGRAVVDEVRDAPDSHATGVVDCWTAGPRA